MYNIDFNNDWLTWLVECITKNNKNITQCSVKCIQIYPIVKRSRGELVKNFNYFVMIC